MAKIEFPKGAQSIRIAAVGFFTNPLSPEQLKRLQKAYKEGGENAANIARHFVVTEEAPKKRTRKKATPE